MINPGKSRATATQHDALFATAHLLPDIRRRALHGGALTLVAQATRVLLQTAATMVLARLLTPGDFGLVAMVTAITGFVNSFKDAGLSVATVQRADLTHAQVSTVFWVNVVVSLGFATLVATLAPAIARFYGQPQLQPIAQALAGTFVFSGLTVQHQALLRRQMRFTALVSIDLISLAAGQMLAIAMALAGFGYWALVGAAVATTAVGCGITWTCTAWMPGLPNLGSGVGSMLRFGSNVTGFNALNSVTRNVDSAIVGAILGSGPLGVYSKAFSLLMLPVNQLNYPVASVVVPMLSRLRHDPEQYRRAFLRAIAVLSVVGTPIVVLSALVADEAIAIVLGPGWEEAARVFRWLAPAAVLATINHAPGWLCLSLDKSKEQLVWAAFAAPVMTVSFLVGAQWGVVGVAVAFSVMWNLMYLIYIGIACHRSPVSMGDIAEECAGPLFASIGACLVTLAAGTLLWPGLPPSVVTLCMKSVSFVAVFLGIAFGLRQTRRQLLSILTDGSTLLGKNKVVRPASAQTP